MNAAWAPAVGMLIGADTEHVVGEATPHDPLAKYSMKLFPLEFISST
jgi:hypothetical protein